MLLHPYGVEKRNHRLNLKKGGALGIKKHFPGGISNMGLAAPVLLSRDECILSILAEMTTFSPKESAKHQRKFMI